MRGMEMKKAFIIAEIGGNHGGDLSYAKKLAMLAKDSGADAVKYQTYSKDLIQFCPTPLGAGLSYTESRSSLASPAFISLPALNLTTARLGITTSFSGWLGFRPTLDLRTCTSNTPKLRSSIF